MVSVTMFIKGRSVGSLDFIKCRRVVYISFLTGFLKSTFWFLNSWERMRRDCSGET